MTTAPLVSGLATAAVGDLSGPLVGRERTSGVQSYDFRKPIQLSREHQRLIQIALEQFARRAITSFTSMLRFICNVSLVSIEQKTYAEYVTSLGHTTYMTIVDTDPLPGSGVLEMPLGSVMLCIDYMLGGIGDDIQPERPLTEIEREVIDRLFEERLLVELRESLAPIAPLSLAVRDVEYNPQFALASAVTDVMVISTFEVRLQDHVTRLSLALPFTGLNPYLVAASAPQPSSGREAAKVAQFSADLADEFANVPVPVSVQLRPCEVAPDAIADLHVGQIITLNHPSSAPYPLVVDGKTLAHATIGRRGKNMAARIVAVENQEHPS